MRMKELFAATMLCSPVRRTLTALSVRIPVFRTVNLFNVVVHRPAGELGVSDGHRTSCAPPEDNDLQYPDDSSSAYQSVWVEDQQITRTQRVINVLGVSSAENVLLHLVEHQPNLRAGSDGHASHVMCIIPSLTADVNISVVMVKFEVYSVKMWWNKTSYKSHISTLVLLTSPLSEFWPEGTYERMHFSTL